MAPHREGIYAENLETLNGIEKEKQRRREIREREIRETDK